MRKQYDRWVVRDYEGLLHAALVYRQFGGDEGDITLIQVSTACRPAVQQVTNSKNDDWSGAQLPLVPLGNSFIVEWRVRATPTCLECIVAPVLE